jgi:hypothetical protein
LLASKIARKLPSNAGSRQNGDRIAGVLPCATSLLLFASSLLESVCSFLPRWIIFLLPSRILLQSRACLAAGQAAAE